MKRFSTILASSGGLSITSPWNDELFGLCWLMPSGCKEQREKQMSHSEHRKIAPLTEISNTPPLTKPQQTDIHILFCLSPSYLYPIRLFTRCDFIV